MTSDTDRIVEDLHKIASELEAVAAQAKRVGKRKDGGFDAALADLHRILNAARGRACDPRGSKDRVRPTTKAANEIIGKNPWRVVAGRAAAALLLGLVFARLFRSSGFAPENSELER